MNSTVEYNTKVMEMVMFTLLMCMVLVVAAEHVHAQTTGEGPTASLPGGGVLRGVYKKSFSGRRVSAYGSVPYGSAQRFASARPADPWNDVLVATAPSPQCLQYSPILNPKSPVIGVEDCLTLDVVTPLDKVDGECPRLLPVVVLIQAGGWAIFGAATYGPLYLLDNDVVHVSPNSRVGILGYLSTKDRHIPGNWGLKDQALALKWVRDNIKAFCGDPDLVTVIGNSSGASGAMYHSYSPLSRGLTHRFVSMSGSANNHFAIAPEPRLKARRLGVLMDCLDPDDSAALLTCLRSKDASDVVAQFGKFSSYDSCPFAPVVEPSSREAFITFVPIINLGMGLFEDKPVMFSSVQGEGLIPGALFLNNEELVKKLNDDWLANAPFVFDYNYTVADDQRDAVSNRIRDHYFGDEPLTDKTLPNLINVLRDRGFLADQAYAAGLVALYNSHPTHYFQFRYFGSTSGATFLGPSLDQLRPYGPAHDDDLGYIYNLTYSYQAVSEEDVAVTLAMSRMIATFARTGHAEYGTESDVVWSPIDRLAALTHSLDLLEINSSSDYKMVTKHNLGDYQFWNSLPLNEPATKRVFNTLDL